MNLRASLRLAFAGLLATGCTSSRGATSGPPPATMPRVSSPAPAAPPSFLVLESATGNAIPLAALIERGALADVVIFGEQHDDPETHFLEFAVLDGLGRRSNQVVLSLEMFERDVQYDLDRYLSGALSEAEFLAAARPWPRYATDYRPMVQLARARGWKVIAANIPRPMASAMARRGMRALDTLTPVERQRAAASLICPNDAYYHRFAAAMSGHSAGGGPPTVADSAAAAAMTQRMYEAQCAKDETMAESIAREVDRMRPRNGIVLHVNGAFHSDYGHGTAERVRRRLPGIRVLLITAVPVEDPASAPLGGHGAKADYVIFTRAAAKKPGD